MFSTFARFAAVAATLSATLLSGSASAAPWVFTTTGVIAYGYDYSGTFGSASGNLAGATYSLSTILDPLAYAYQYHYNFNGTNSGYQYGYGANSGSVTQKVTINGKSQSYSMDPTKYNWGQSYMQASPTFTEAYQQASGTTADGQSVYVNHYVYSYSNQFTDGMSYQQNLKYKPVAGDSGYAYFNNYGSKGQTYFQAYTPTTISIHGDVPEPAPLALFGLGLVALAFARRKTA